MWHTGLLRLCVSFFSVLVLISLWFLVEGLFALGISCGIASELQVFMCSIVESTGFNIWGSGFSPIVNRKNTLCFNLVAPTSERAVRPQSSQPTFHGTVVFTWKIRGLE